MEEIHSGDRGDLIFVAVARLRGGDLHGCSAVQGRNRHRTHGCATVSQVGGDLLELHLSLFLPNAATNLT
ncbi:hypothetical protein L484_026588 [Morus notabilis]|uniref:Uncharacterized protein n=1 Tax=Morus notabilis TaxID=981085 RepID=W9SKD4_9ROSA|nr:hypothetical protein L484_026588 [Morus notabilis]